MSTEILENFYKRYQYPFVEQLTLGYAGIDPPLKTDGTGLNHEDLDGLLGGNDNGHYHITKKQLERLEEIYGFVYFPKILPDQKIDTIADEEIIPYEIRGKNIKIGE